MPDSAATQIPLVSVIIPTYSRPENLLRAISSVRAQDYPEIEVIVVDDNGAGTEWQQATERLLAPLVHEGAVSYLKHGQNRNGSAARNTGFNASSGKFVIFMDDDDELSPTRVSEGVRALQRNPGVSAAYCDTLLKSPAGEKMVENTTWPNPVMALLTGRMVFNTSTVIFRRQCINWLGGFDESFERHQDYELYMRFFRNNSIVKSGGCHVVKYETPNTVSGAPLKRIGHLEKFFDTFRADIDSWPEAPEVYYTQYRYLTRNLIEAGCTLKGLQYLVKTMRYKRPDLRFILSMLAKSLRNIVLFK